MIGIITAMSCEAEMLESVMQNVSSRKLGAWNFTLGTIGETQAVLAVCGVGKVFAGSCAQTMIINFNCTHIFSVGVAGSLEKSVAIGDIICADATVQYDMDTSAIGDPVGLISGLNVIQMPCDSGFTERFADFLADRGRTLKTGIIATGDKFVSKYCDKTAISESFGALACEMEGGAVGQICHANQIPYNVIRMITDNASEGSGNEYTVNLEEIAAALAKLFADFFKSLR